MRTRIQVFVSCWTHSAHSVIISRSLSPPSAAVSEPVEDTPVVVVQVVAVVVVQVV